MTTRGRTKFTVEAKQQVQSIEFRRVDGTAAVVIAAGLVLSAGMIFAGCSNGSGESGSAQAGSTPTSGVVANDDQRGDDRSAATPVVLTSKGQVAALDAAVREARTLTRDEIRKVWSEGVSLYQTGDFHEAVVKLGDAASGRPDHAYTHYLYGLALWKTSQDADAERELALSSTLDPAFVKTWINLGRVRMDESDPDGALVAADSALALVPDSADALHVKGRALWKLNRGDEAETTLMAAQKADPENGYIANTLGYLLLVRGKTKESIPFLEAARDRLPHVVYVRNNLGTAYEKAGEIEKAAVEFRAAKDEGDTGGQAAAGLERLSGEVAAGVK